MSGGHLVAPWNGRACRAVPPTFAIQGEVFSGTYAAVGGGRWNRSGLQAVYASLESQTVLAEVGRLDLGAGFTGVIEFRRTIVWFEARLSRTLDLRDSAVLAHFGLDADELLKADWKSAQASGHEPLPQAVGRALIAGSIEAIFVPSAQRREGTNLVVFPLTLLPESSLVEPTGLRAPRKRPKKKSH